MSGPSAATQVAPPSRSRRAIAAVVRMGQGTERPWDPTNRLGLMVLCLGMLAGFSLYFTNFFTVSNAFTILLSMTAIGIAAFGSALLVIAGNVDLSIGGIYALTAVVTGLVARDTQEPLLAICVGIVGGGAIGFLNGNLVRALKINPLIVTLAMAAILRGLAYLLSEARSVFGFPDPFVAIGRASIGPVPLPVAIAGMVFLVGGYILLKTVVGLHIYAVGGNPVSARLSGIRTERLVTTLFAVNGALVGLVAVLTVSRLGSAQPSIGGAFELDVLTAVILGGIAFNGGAGHPLGVLIGVITIGSLNAGIIFAGVPDFWQQITRGAVLLLALGADQLAIRRREKAHTPSIRDEAPSTEPRSLARPAPRTDSIMPSATWSSRLASCASHMATSRPFARCPSRSVRARSCASWATTARARARSSRCSAARWRRTPDRILVDGQPVTVSSPADARQHGIETAYQDLALCPNLGARYNLVLGSEPVRLPMGPLSIRDDRAAERIATSRLAQLGIVLDDDERPVRLLSGGQRQSVAIARIAGEGVKAVILDEPTAALGVKQTRNVLDLVRELARRGTAVILISHDIDTVFEVADRVVVLRLGRVVHEGRTQDLTPIDLVHLMAGLSVGLPGPTAPVPPPTAAASPA